MLIYPDDSWLASMRCVFSCLCVCHKVWWLRHFLVVALFTLFLSLTLAHKHTHIHIHTHIPHPQTGHWWNAAPGILPQHAGSGAAAGWNMIRPLSKHVFLHGCVQGRADNGNASGREEASCSWSARFSWMCAVLIYYIPVKVTLWRNYSSNNTVERMSVALEGKLQFITDYPFWWSVYCHNLELLSFNKRHALLEKYKGFI